MPSWLSHSARRYFDLFAVLSQWYVVHVAESVEELEDLPIISVPPGFGCALRRLGSQIAGFYLGTSGEYFRDGARECRTRRLSKIDEA